MNIGILTHHYPENRNYGAMLQLFALYNILKEEGHTPYIVNYIFISQRSHNGLKNRLKAYIIDRVTTKKFRQFSNAYMPNKTIPVNSQNIKELDSQFDKFIVGSDQVWRYSYVPSIENFFLDFVSDSNKKVSYAASFGIDKWSEAPKEITDKVSILIKQFRYVSVREKSGVEICKSFNVDAHLVADPVFLLTKSYYLYLANKHRKNMGSKKYIAKMVLDESKELDQLIVDMETSLDSKIVDLKGVNIPIISRFSKTMFSVPEWIQLLNESLYVVTDSFHCIAFCLILNKPFICYPNKTRGIARLTSLLSLFNLENRIVDAEGLVNINDLVKESIDFSKVNEIINLLRADSMDFLKTSLTND